MLIEHVHVIAIHGLVLRAWTVRYLGERPLCLYMGMYSGGHVDAAGHETQMMHVMGKICHHRPYDQARVSA